VNRVLPTLAASVLVGCTTPELTESGICGDGSIDDLEECDDNNSMSHDGCSSGCLIEQPTWRRVLDLQTIPRAFATHS
jgi:cysteine-rich repeat protein